MKRIKRITFIAFFLLSLGSGMTAQALAINCGCRKLKKALKKIDGGELSSESAQAVAKCHGGAVVKVCL
ncbi:hypothetical protein [Marivirga arenosa]|jgi:putative Mn2+ efflux pump MntP|uniref:Uncharacterized protein n=1 Tax=Marivirga arenosa TaxID=3059076 RepID=A0AA49J962_9BACT|nr:hypothetical protein [Marivirga sp. BKB1-2]WKK79326.1 hypothetical protein QYS47_18040 [Marivirga sp. BKB1-2]